MPIDVEKLLSYRIAPVRQRLSRQDAAFYALSVGMGQDPEDPRQLDYVDFTREMAVLPSMALVLAHPGFWLGDPNSGVDATQVVHGEQALTLHQALPVDTELVSETMIDSLVDKGPGQGALLYTRKTLREAESGTLIVSTLNTTFIRGGGGFGGSDAARKVSPKPPEGDPSFVIDLPTRPEQALYYRLNGDHNPLHADPQVAIKAGFPRPILHGLCTLGMVCHGLLRTLCDYRAARLSEMSLRFASPVYPGETLRCEIWQDGSFRASVVERDVLVISHGKATVAPAER
ncbi:MaoC/PaaZ C-terminal domain-containing protein [Pseudomonas piscis]|uniref:MaoC family dehydratase n=1 Tax=Pseudomonas piscis TaxID=2614538 RepID=UPI0039A69AA6